MSYIKGNTSIENDRHDPIQNDVKGSVLERIKQLANGRSGRKLEKVWGINASTINSYILRGSIPSLDKAISIATAEGVSVQWLATGQDAIVEQCCNQDAIAITKYNVVASAGGGSFIDTENETDTLNVSKQWLRQKRLMHKKLCIIEAKGNSMEPFIHDGDDLFVNLIEEPQWKPFDGVYVIRLDELLKVKRLEYCIMRDGYRVVSDNTDYAEEFVTRNDIDERLKVIGEVVMVLGQPTANSQQPKK
ncbi:LexA family transcriptional regulator [Vibrio sp. Sgm 5]|uniref:LexA family transcriptional regulator n=1 Tax=Vibrio sp. Sgm 5 TaxID=2994387 RepID=UPI0022498134|nr:S24 family peptidase [Vibrio sp. Sgm 5]MCX2788383.1 helix-turn-helix domain-containing protein [Vibrio sp. Sgm 5]